MIRRKAMMEAGGYAPEVSAEDLYILLKISSLGYSVCTLDDVLIHYRLHGNNMSKNFDFMLEGALAALRHFREHPAYDKVCMYTLHSHLLQTAVHDRPLAMKILKSIPLRAYRLKTLRGIAKLIAGSIVGSKSGSDA